MSEQMSQELLKRLDVAIEKMSVAGLYSWDLLVRKVYWIDGWLDLSLGLALALMSYGAMRGAFAAYKRWVRLGENDMEELSLGMALLFGVASQVLLVGALVNIISAPVRILMPDYYALQALLELIKK